MRREIGAAVVKKRLQNVVIRPVLYADECDACGKRFQMRESSGNVPTAHMSGIFNRGASGYGSNIFMATACSFACAHEIFANGGWRKMEEYKEFARADASLHRVTLTISDDITGETELRRQWEEKHPVDE